MDLAEFLLVGEPPFRAHAEPDLEALAICNAAISFAYVSYIMIVVAPISDHFFCLFLADKGLEPIHTTTKARPSLTMTCQEKARSSPQNRAATTDQKE